MVAGGRNEEGRMDLRRARLQGTSQEPLREEEPQYEEPEETSNAHPGSGGRERFNSVRNEPEAASAVSKGSNNRGNREGDVKTHTITGGSIGASWEEEESSPLGESRKEQRERLRRSREPALITENN
ncbi:hypothetical protein Y1Q_0001217 [Alligator mississippiensis]|uniref:Uncharacterized protein n=1 Tax=Alligator mississippiensis TaxID=8496 RepID=A0A151PEG2_ALLMI|nr:hypothetical protein Y1Q_0001217 [Alligator mississippiensis]